MQLSKKAFTILSAVLAFGLLPIQGSFAASSVYVNEDSGSVGVGASKASVDDAADAAASECGSDCDELDASSDKGFGAVASGKDEDGATVFGTAFGLESKEDAEAEALDACSEAGAESPAIVKSWEDTAGGEEEDTEESDEAEE